ncbi:hypothetical protein MPTK1_2g03920 [Marchantia polymorpha subsp. ruderalis]|uniref:Uncharacterized protein n=1 Tax=Marchantia polymorpha TaxID=3197 RepID=A0A2R6X7I6_MARPO|nr:hypothetical protein MARPO_0031s0048 [Marchantia polymorpha]BBN01013.1 hypothetical protein Mp_2g03920 [Marchantia polymorpha subsp. ruderalis]|eukprot:PTQ42062.1 hypothetical protein MARPO_0031s0048 [Marchantia polymorpha]
MNPKGEDVARRVGVADGASRSVVERSTSVIPRQRGLSNSTILCLHREDCICEKKPGKISLGDPVLQKQASRKLPDKTLLSYVEVRRPFLHCTILFSEPGTVGGNGTSCVETRQTRKRIMNHLVRNPRECLSKTRSSTSINAEGTKPLSTSGKSTKETALD